MEVQSLEKLKKTLRPAKVANTINYQCGCMAVLHRMGDLKGKGWQIIACREHSKDRDVICEAVCQDTWKG